MVHTALRPALLGAVLVAIIGAAAPALAQRPAGATAAPAVPQQVAAPPVVLDDADADATRQRLLDVLSRYPPSLGLVLKLDPTLMTNQEYLASYPALSGFLAQHPEVARNPGFFLDRFRVAGGDYTNDPKWQARQDFNNMIGNFSAFLVFVIVTGVLIWLIRLFVDHRRWNRLSKVQTDVHTKLLDRFTSNEDLLAYIQTPAGRRFLESAPIQLHDESRPLGAPFSRILWSVQAGVVLALAGLGLLFVSTRFSDEPSHFFFVVGIVTFALGAGFIVSAGAAYVLSRRLGLLERPTLDHA